MHRKLRHTSFLAAGLPSVSGPPLGGVPPPQQTTHLLRRWSVVVSVIVTGSILIEFELTDLWEQSLSEFTDSNFSLCDVEDIVIDEA